MHSSRIAEVIRSAQTLAQPIHVHGASIAARALLAARFSYEAPGSVVVVCPDDDAAASFASDLECLSQTVDDQSLNVFLFPSWEQSPYSPIAPSIRTRLDRLRVLASLSQGSEKKCVITSLPALCQATSPRDIFEKFSIHIKTNASIESREALILRLLASGYLRVDPVEDPGTFAVRGEIIDIFPPDREQPLRIELFDDLVEKIRTFDPQSQRTAQEPTAGLSEFVVPPAREVLINSHTLATLREKIKERADDLGISRAIRDPILASVQDGTYPDHSDTWSAFAYPNGQSSLLDYLPDDITVIWSDELSALQLWDEFLDEQKRLAADSPQQGLILPPVEKLFGWNPRLEAQIRAKSRLFLDQIVLANLEAVEKGAAADAGDDAAFASGASGALPSKEPIISENHRVFTRSNKDLGGGSRDSLGELETQFKLWQRQGFKILCLASTQCQQERIRFLLEDRGFACVTCTKDTQPQPSVISLDIGSLSEGFRWPAEGLVVITEGEILGSRHVRAKKTKKTTSAAKDWAGLQALSDLSVGDAIVHVDHGIGRYQGLVRLSLSGAPSDFLLLEYANKDKLYLPVYRLNVIQKYAGHGAEVSLDKLGSQHFAKAKEKVRDAVKRLAIDLVKLYAERKVRPGVAFAPRDASFREFEAKFAFDETPDQLRAIDETLSDMESGKVMDRLICGDVGYGKTEVAIRAAFRAVSDGKQVVVLVPTTVLAFQHEQSFRARLKEYPINIESVSRFKSQKEQKAILESVAKGKVDIIIGTHRLFSRDVKFNDLGLIIVDEEQRFGVEHKERLKTLKTNTHVLTLTATPIPRTLHMALAGLRDISLINTPPVDRLPIRTYVSKFDDSLVQRAIEFELARGGQVFFLHNRVQTIYETANKIRELVPGASVGVGHGQMSEGELEEAMISFYQKKTNVLVCTTIIESGLDLPSANTMIMNRADSLGLAQLYQIRGRVGRGQSRAYAYLFIPAEGAVTEDAKKRLEVIQRFVELGSGFNIASHDLEIRGGGDLLGPQQSGHIAAVGFDLYTELLEEAIAELEGKPIGEESSREPEIKAPFPAYLGEEYVPDVHQRLSLYRRFSSATGEAELESLEQELADRFGPLPPEALNLLWLIRVKLLLKSTGIEALTVGPEKMSLIPGPASRLDPVRAIGLISGNPNKYQLTPDSKFIVTLGAAPSATAATGPGGAPPTLRDLYFSLEQLFKTLMTPSPKAATA
jgi:transcription-repair coupling factor (superfamily II helicase)